MLHMLGTICSYSSSQTASVASGQGTGPHIIDINAASTEVAVKSPERQDL